MIFAFGGADGTNKNKSQFIQIGIMSIPNTDHVNLLLSAAFAPIQPADMGEFDQDAEGIS